jgi:hypothetical protein
MVRASLCDRCLHVEGCDLKPNNKVHYITTCICFCPSGDEPHEDIIEKLDLIRMKNKPGDKPKPPV